MLKINDQRPSGAASITLHASKSAMPDSTAFLAATDGLFFNVETAASRFRLRSVTIPGASARAAVVAKMNMELSFVHTFVLTSGLKKHPLIKRPLKGSNSYASKEEARMLNYDLTPAD